MDLSKSVLLGTTELNDGTIVSSGGPIVGCVIETADYSGLDVRQHIVPLAKADGAEAGGVWVTSRAITLSGTVYGSTRIDAYNRLAALEAALTPTTGQTTGTTTLVFHVPTAGGDIERTITVRPNGMRHVDLRRQHGGSSDSFPLAIPWTATLLAQPGVSDVTTLYSTTIQETFQFVTWGSPYSTLPLAPSEGDLLVAFTISRSSDDVPFDDVWTLEGEQIGNNEYGGYFASPVYLRCYSRIAGAGEDTSVMHVGNIGSGLGEGCYVLMMEFGETHVVEQVTGTAFRWPPYTHVDTSVIAPTVGTLFFVMVYGRQGYFNPEYLTEDVGTTVIVEDGDGPPGIMIGTDWGVGTLAAGATSGYWIESDGQRPSGTLRALVRSTV